MSLEFQDADTNIKIKAVAFDEAVKVVDRNVNVGLNYAIYKAHVKEAFVKSNVGYHDCDLHLYTHTKVLFSAIFIITLRQRLTSISLQFELLEDAEDYVKPTENYSTLSYIESGDIGADTPISNIL